jgi:carbonic anhydrase/acetyltransferase-like protein (isoleucine patch superfamily)
MLYALGGVEPRIHPDAYVHPLGVVIGDVTIGAWSSVWPGAVLRGDDGPIVVGERTSVQDGAVVHVREEDPTTIGSNCTIGHLAHLEGCDVDDHVLIGVGAIVLRKARVASWALVGAGAVVPPGRLVPEGALAVGVPATIKEGAAKREDVLEPIEKYVRRVARYKAELREVGDAGAGPRPGVSSRS